MPKQRWTIRYELGGTDLPARLRESLGERLTAVAETLEALIHARSSFWRMEQGLEVYLDGWRVEYRVDLGDERIIVVGGTALPKSGWTIRYERGVTDLPARLRRPLGKRLIGAADTLAEIIHPLSSFWKAEQGLQLRLDGWRVEYRVDLEDERIVVTGAEHDG